MNLFLLRTQGVKPLLFQSIFSIHFSKLLKNIGLLLIALIFTNILYSNKPFASSYEDCDSFITAEDDAAIIPYCEEAIDVCYDFTIFDDCTAIDLADVSFNSNGSGLDITSTNTVGNLTSFEACGSVSAGEYTFTIVYDAQVVQREFIVVQQDTTVDFSINFPESLDFTIPVCQSSMEATIEVDFGNVCNPFGVGSATLSFDGEILQANHTNVSTGHFEYPVTLDLTNNGGIVLATYTDSEGVSTSEASVITVNQQIDTLAPIITYPTENINAEVYLCDDVLNPVCFEITAIDNCDGELIPNFTINGLDVELNPTEEEGSLYCLTLSDGEHEILVEAADEVGNLTSENFIITVTEVVTPEVDLTCVDSIHIALVENCQIELKASDVLTGEWACLTNDDFVVNVEDSDASNGATIDGVGTYAYTVEANLGVDAGNFETCTGEVIVDITAPTMTCQEDTLVLSMGPFDCTAYFFIPMPIINDSCVAYELFAEVYYQRWFPLDFGTLNGYWKDILFYSGMPGGYVSGVAGNSSFIRYYAIASGDTSSIDCPILVLDNVIPYAGCDDDLHISIGGAGYSRIYAEDVDEGSHDNCSDVRIEVRREGGEWAEYIDFPCEDINTYVTIELRVWDDANQNQIYGDWYGNNPHNIDTLWDDSNDNVNTCSLEILIEDKINPSCIAPANVSTTCDNIANLGIDWNDMEQVNEIFGAASAEDNCHAVAEQTNIDVNLSDCGWGTVVRTFEAVDDWGLVSLWACAQVITIYPEDLSIAISDYDVFCIDMVNCERVVEIDFEITSFCDIETLDIEGLIDFDADGVNDGNAILTAGTISQNTQNYTISTNAPAGMHRFILTVSDSCANEITLEIPFEVVDCNVAPPQCINGLTVTLMPQPVECCAMAIWAADFIIGSFSDCTEPVTYSIHRGDNVDAGTEIPNRDQTGIVLDCNDEATVVIYIYAWDSANNPYAVQPDGSVGGANYDFCATYVLVQEHISCNSVEPIRVAGAIMTEENEGIEGVEVALSGNSFQNALTGNDGYYEFENYVEDGFNYTITPYLDIQAHNAISTIDFILIIKHILGNEILDSPYKIIAADINSSQTVTVADLIELRQLILGIYDEFPNNTFWRFVDADYAFPNYTNPWAEGFPEVRNIQALQQDELSQDFIGIAIGDVNGSAIPNLVSEPDDKNGNDSFILKTKDISLKAGADYKIDFTATDLAKIEGYQFTLLFDKAILDFESIEYGISKTENFGLNYVSEGMITTSWDKYSGMLEEEDSSNEVLFNLHFHANADGILSDLLSLSSRVTKAEAYDDDGILDVAIDFVNETIKDAYFEEDLIVEIGEFDAFCIDTLNCESEVIITFDVTSLCAIDGLNVEGLIDLNTDSLYDGSAVITLDTVIGNTYAYTMSTNAPAGVHSFALAISDSCDNVVMQEIPFQVVDCHISTPGCINGVTVTLVPQPDGCCAMAIWALDFIASPISDCTIPITYSIHEGNAIDAGVEIPNRDQTGIVLDCMDNATVVLYIYAWDNADNPYAVQPDGSVGGSNYDYCITYVLLQEALNCPMGEPDANIAGIITTEDDEGIESVEVALSGNEFQDAITAFDGFYEFEHAVSWGFDYTITPHLDVQAPNAISTYDFLLISKHILGIQTLDSPYKIIAADVNSSETVSIADLIQLRKLILGIYDEFPNNTFWRFVDADYSFPNPANPWAEAFPEVRNIHGLFGSQYHEDFIGIAIGDVNGSGIPNLVDEDESRDDLFVIATKDISLKAGADYKIDFTATDLAKIEGYQFTLLFDKAILDFESIEYGISKTENFGLNYVSEGMITTSWDKYSGMLEEEDSSNEVLFSLHFHANADGILSDLLSLSSRVTKAEAYDTEGILDIAIDFVSENLTKTAFEVYQNYPNPFRGETKIAFNLPEDAEVTVTIQDIEGRTLKSVEMNGLSGYNSVAFNANALGVAGVFYYTVSTAEYTATKRMIIVK